MAKFKIGDKIEAVSYGIGFDKATVLGIIISQEKRTKGKKMYYLKIMNGTATVPISAEINYRLVKEKK